MLTRFFLNGGNSSSDTPKNREYKQAVIGDLADGDRVLFCYFGKAEGDWQQKFAKDSAIYGSMGKQLVFKPASIENFVEECSQSRLIVLGGGDAFVLINRLKQYPNLVALFKGKVVAATSAGACALSAHFYSNDESRVADGIGILKIKVHCHYLPEKYSNLEKLNAHGSDLDIIALPEQHYVEIYN